MGPRTGVKEGLRNDAVPNSPQAVTDKEHVLLTQAGLFPVLLACQQGNPDAPPQMLRPGRWCPAGGLSRQLRGLLDVVEDEVNPVLGLATVLPCWSGPDLADKPGIRCSGCSII